MIADIRTHREINGHDPKIGYEWDAGVIPQRIGFLGGRITVRLTQDCWEIVSVTFRSGVPNDKRVIETHPLGDDGERTAKARAREIYVERSRQA